tara:strand:+ start:54 stop:464 length:411 start_codon:yes stop_codon:yes gene_type:complete
MSKKEKTPRIPGFYTEDDGSYTVIGQDGKEIKNPYEPLENAIYNNISWKGLKRLFEITAEVGKDLGKDLIDDTKTKFGVIGTDLRALATYIGEEDQKAKLRQSRRKIIWSEKYNKYMSEYDEKKQQLIDIRRGTGE